METAKIPGTDLKFSRIGLGTWAMGGWMWGGTDENESIRTILSAIDRGITLIDTAPVYGFGKSEEIVGKALESAGVSDSDTIRFIPVPSVNHRRLPVVNLSFDRIAAN